MDIKFGGVFFIPTTRQCGEMKTTENKALKLNELIPTGFKYINPLSEDAFEPLQPGQIEIASQTHLDTVGTMIQGASLTVEDGDDNAVSDHLKNAGIKSWEYTTLAAAERKPILPARKALT